MFSVDKELPVSAFLDVKCSLEKKFIKLANGNKLWTVIANKNVSQRTPIVMVHGFAGGVGLWVNNFFVTLQ